MGTVLIAFVLATLGASPDCIPASEETLVLFEADRAVCMVLTK